MVSCQPLKLLKEDERKNSVWSNAEVIGRKAFPQSENTFLSDHSYKHILETQGETKC